jgi:hypothetical protein
MSGQFLEVVREGGKMSREPGVLNPLMATGQILGNIANLINDRAEGAIDEMEALLAFDKADQQFTALHSMLLESAWNALSEYLTEEGVSRMRDIAEMRSSMETEDATKIRLSEALWELTSPVTGLPSEQQQALRDFIEDLQCDNPDHDHDE